MWWHYLEVTTRGFQHTGREQEFLYFMDDPTLESYSRDLIQSQHGAITQER